MIKFFYTDLDHLEYLDEEERKRFDELQEKGHVGLTNEEYQELENYYRYCQETYLRKHQGCTEK